MKNQSKIIFIFSEGVGNLQTQDFRYRAYILRI